MVLDKNKNIDTIVECRIFHGEYYILCSSVSIESLTDENIKQIYIVHRCQLIIVINLSSKS